jgi:hypothetical protein
MQAGVPRFKDIVAAIRAVPRIALTPPNANVALAKATPHALV